MRNYLEDDVPTWVVMRDLFAQGFNTSKHQLLQFDGSQRVIGSKNDDFVNRRFFLLCLMNWESLKARGLELMSTAQPHAYYKVLLASQSPHLVPLKLSDIEYKKICDGGPLPEPVMAIEDYESREEDEEEDEEKAADQGEEEEEEDRPLAPLKRRRICLAVDDDADVDADADSGTSSSSSSSCPADKQGSSFATGVFIGLKPVHCERHLELGQRGSYVRLIVGCPRHSAIQAPNSRKRHLCMKKRNINISRGGEGVREALAFLVAWSLAVDRVPHIQFQPTRPMITNALEHFMHTVSGGVDELISKIVGS